MHHTELSNLAERQRLQAVTAGSPLTVARSRNPLRRLARRLRRDVPPYGTPVPHAVRPMHGPEPRHLRLVAADRPPEAC